MTDYQEFNCIPCPRPEEKGKVLLVSFLKITNESDVIPQYKQYLSNT